MPKVVIMIDMYQFKEYLERIKQDRQEEMYKQVDKEVNGIFDKIKGEEEILLMLCMPRKIRGC